MLKFFCNMGGARVFAERRRYRTRMFTWLSVEQDGQMVLLGDPWPCTVPAFRDVYAAGELLRQAGRLALPIGEHLGIIELPG